MFIRSITAACALCLVVPAVASAQPIYHPPAAHLSPTGHGAVVGDTKYDLHVAANDRNISRATNGRLPRAIAPAAATPVVADGRSTDGWRIAAIAEATLLAGVAAATVLALARRRRGPELGV